MTGILAEACVTTAAEASAAGRAGAHRLELCHDLETGGLTPSFGLVTGARTAVGLPRFVMIRPRAGDFRTRPGVVSAMLRDIAALRAQGVDGMVLGVLDESSRIDEAALAELVAAAGLPVTFHRAFDHVPDPLDALERLAAAGVARVLTSGGSATAWEGRALLRALASAAGDRLTVMAGGSVRGDHVLELVRQTGIREVHARASAIPDIVRALRTGSASSA